jgi:hypothetical protein
MGRPRKLEQLTQPLSGRIRIEQDIWLRALADQKFDGEISKALRWALDQAQVFDVIMSDPDPVWALDDMLHPEKYAPDPEAEIAEAERELQQWKRDQAVKRAQRKAQLR